MDDESDIAPASAPADDILVMRGITKTFPGVVALEDVNLSVRRGEIHAICGENGAGKSTLMKVLSGVHPAGDYEGEIVFDGRPVRFSNIRDSEHVGIVIIHQELALVPYLSIAENIFLGNERRGRAGLIDWNRANADAGRLLDEVGLGESPVTPVGQLGVGKQQLVEIAKALSKDVRLLILDEPTAALDVRGEAQFYGRFLDITHELTTVIISHRFATVRRADAICVLDGGRITERGSHEELVAAGGTYARMYEMQAARFGTKS
jgi:putative multiple sugar transport system ATP-binding protein